MMDCWRMMQWPLYLLARDRNPDDPGRFLKEIQDWSNDNLERTHNYIQWLFPLAELSGFNSGAPVLDENTIQHFRGSPELRANLRTSFVRMLVFYGFDMADDPLRVVPSKSFCERARNWMNRSNHNHLRITRILKSVTTLGLEEEAIAFFQCLEALYRLKLDEQEPQISEGTFLYWRSAVNSDN
jgi:Opioid growth factor receptor (OGFr) conserved region